MIDNSLKINEPWASAIRKNFQNITISVNPKLLDRSHDDIFMYYMTENITNVLVFTYTAVQIMNYVKLQIVFLSHVIIH